MCHMDAYEGHGGQCNCYYIHWDLHITIILTRLRAESTAFSSTNEIPGAHCIYFEYIKPEWVLKSRIEYVQIHYGVLVTHILLLKLDLILSTFT